MPGRPCCSCGTSCFSAAGFVTWIGGFLTVAHVIPECLLMARELEPERGVPSEPSAELIPFLFGVVTRAILVVWTICHLRSERISFAVVHTEDRTRDLSQAETGRYQIPPCAGHGNSEPGGQPLCYHCAFCTVVPLLEIA